MGWDYYGYKPYVPVAQRRAQAAREVAKRVKKGEKVTPVVIDGRTITTTFWGRAWCDNLESYSDYENRLPRGRTYVRNGSVVDLKIEPGRIKALVSGSTLYEITIEIAPLAKSRWLALKKEASGQIGSLVELLQGRLSKGVMELVTDRERGLFPSPKEIKVRCSCPDYAGLCKHLAAVMYGIGHRLDTSPELLFTLRGVDHAELIEQAIPKAPGKAKAGTPTIAAADLGAIFDIEIDAAPVATPKPAPRKSARSKATPPPTPVASAKPTSVKSTRSKAATSKTKTTTKTPTATKSETTTKTVPTTKMTKTTTKKKTPGG